MSLSIGPFISSSLADLAAKCRHSKLPFQTVLSHVRVIFASGEVPFAPYENQFSRVQKAYERCIQPIRNTPEPIRKSFREFIKYRMLHYRYAALSPLVDDSIKEATDDLLRQQLHTILLKEVLKENIGNKTQRRNDRDDILHTKVETNTNLNKLNHSRSVISSKMIFFHNQSMFLKKSLKNKTTIDLDELDTAIGQREALKASVFRQNGWLSLILDHPVHDDFDCVLREAFPSRVSFCERVRHFFKFF